MFLVQVNDVKRLSAVYGARKINSPTLKGILTVFLTTHPYVVESKLRTSFAVNCMVREGVTPKQITKVLMFSILHFLFRGNFEKRLLCSEAKR